MLLSIHVVDCEFVCPHQLEIIDTELDTFSNSEVGFGVILVSVGVLELLPFHELASPDS